jgi:UDP:flavonoid glycosyltransferase YjiC (YdhE family)
MAKRIVLTTCGSDGDLNPLLALAIGLRERGHAVMIATFEIHHERVARFNLPFVGLGPWNVSASTTVAPDADVQAAHFVRDVMFQEVRQAYQKLKIAAEGADLLVSQMASFAAPLVAASTGIPWASVVLQPLGFFSAFDPVVLFDPSSPSGVRELDLATHRRLLNLNRRVWYSWAWPVRQLRAELGLPPGCNPIYEDHHSQDLVLALFSKTLGPVQPDWPVQARITGFAFLDASKGEVAVPAGLREFLAAGPPPIIFTLGSQSAADTSGFFWKSIQAAALLGRRAVLIGKGTPAILAAVKLRPAVAAANIVAFNYAPYSSTFPHAAVVVHHGGMGTLAAALRAGRPMVVVPYSHEQPHAALRVVKLGCARVISGSHYTAASGAGEIARVLGDRCFARAALAVQQEIAVEDGVTSGCGALEAFMARVA